MNYRIVVDAGHGGDDPGAVNGNLKEKDYALKAANYMYNRFRELGVPVVLTRDSDKTLSRQERLNTMKSLGTDPNVIILSNHINAGGGEGAEVVYPLRTSPVLPRMILESIGEEGQIMRNYYQRRLPENPSKDYYYIMRETPNTTALLIEYGFIDNPNDINRINNNLLNYAEAVVKAVSNYIGIPYIMPGTELENTYIVKPGDTLYSIAKKYNTTVNNIRLLNNLLTDSLFIGQILNIGEEVKEDKPVSSNTYIVEEGDTLYKIANKFNITIDELISLNDLSSTLLLPNQEIIISKEIPIPDVIEEYEEYTVLPGDTLYSISRKYNTSIEDIISLNNLTSNTLSIGQLLLIPKEDYNNEIIYTVKRGDSLWQIAYNFNTTVDNIKIVNNLSSNIIRPGQELIIK